MVFVAPLFLLGLLTALLPLLIHLIRRERPPKVAFSSIRFLQKTSRKLILFQNIQQWLLLFLRALLFLLLAVAFARPLLDSSVAGFIEGIPESHVILMDRSMSMSFGGATTRANTEASAILSNLGPADELAIVEFGEAPLRVYDFSSERSSLENGVLANNETSYQGTNYWPAFKLADQLLENAVHEKKVITLISDFQAEAFGEEGEGWRASVGVNIQGIDVGKEEISNLAIMDIRAPDFVLEGEEPPPILARIRSTGTVPITKGIATFKFNGEVKERLPFDLEDRSEVVLEFRQDLSEPGGFFGEITLSGDEFLTDNKREFSVLVSPRINVLLINGEPSTSWYDDEGHWFRLAVDAAGQSPFLITEVSSINFDDSDLDSVDVVAILNVGMFDSGQINSLVNFVESGGGVFLAPGDQTLLDSFNDDFSLFLPGTIRSQGKLARGDYRVVADYDRRHPIFSNLESDWSAKFDAYWALEPNEDAAVLMQFDSAEPALLAAKRGAGLTLMFATPMDLEWGDFPLQNSYLPLIHESLRFLDGASNFPLNYEIGDSISLPSGSSYTLTNVDGSEVQYDREISSFTPLKPGTYFLTGDTELTSFSVKSSALESVFNPIDPSIIFDTVVGRGTSPPISRAVSTERLIEERENVQQIWWWILLASIILFFSELFIANRTYR